MTMKIYVVDRTGREHALEALEGWRVMEVIRDWGLPMKAECGGAAICGTCLVKVARDWNARVAAPGEDEQHMLDELGVVDPKTRLSCQILLSPELDGLRVELVPEEETATV
jgi:ferredoxin, 2Fe-2S